MKKRTTPPTARRHSGFTLIEMLIVVAIIAILVAVSIPLVNTALERARKATDAANERAAKAEATIMYLNGDITTSGQLVYNATEGSLAAFDSSAAYTGYGKCADHKGGLIVTDVNADTGAVTIKWIDTSGTEIAVGKNHNGVVDN